MNSIKILVVESKNKARLKGARLLDNYIAEYPFMDEKIVFKLIEASTAETAIQSIIDHNPEILLLGNKLPGNQSFDLLNFLKNNNISVEVAMFNGNTSDNEFVTIVDDLVEQKVLKDLVQKLNDDDKKVRNQFLTILSHELKSPLNAVEGYLRMMKKREAGDEVESYDAMIDRSLSRISGMRNLIQNLLDFSRITRLKPVNELQSFSIKELVDETIKDMIPMANQKKVEIFVHSNNEVNLIADHDDFEIIFNNLLSNAIKYNEEGGRVDIVIEETKEYLEIQCEDTGIGMTMEETARVFNEFVRIRNEKTRNISGSGLGLSIIKQIVENYNGKIAVESVPDQGTTITIKFPKPVKTRI
jgi:two-component system, sensor histidine kinase and response regulator